MIFVFLVGFLSQDYLSKPKLDSKVNRIVEAKKSLGQLSEASLVYSLAEEADLPVVVDTIIRSELAIAEKETSGIKTEEASIKAVPIFNLEGVSREIIIHQVQTGESIKLLAQKYNLTENTIKWANGLKNNSLKVGQKLKILPLDGIIYKVKAGDTLDKIVAKYKGNAQRVTVFNDLELSGIKKGQEIIIPEGILPKKERPDYVPPVVRQAPRVFYNYTYGNGGGGRKNVHRIPFSLNQTAGNRYVPGNCTWYSYERRKQLGKPIPPVTWGHARTWAANSQRYGYRVDRTPSAGAIFQTTSGYYGHVGIVEEVLPSGDIIITEMNYRGLYVVTKSTLSKNSVGNFVYIH